MSQARTDSILASIRDLEARDTAHASELDAVVGLVQGADRVRARADELVTFLHGVPGERTALDTLEPDLRQDRDHAADDVDAATQRLERLQAKRRAAVDELDQARREHATAVSLLADVEARLARLLARRVELDDLETAARAEGEGLHVEASDLAGRIGAVPRISHTARLPPGAGLDGLVDWGARAHAGLFVVRTQLETEREGVLREATELGTSVLGEPLGGSSVALVRERIERVLAG